MKVLLTVFAFVFTQALGDDSQEVCSAEYTALSKCLHDAQNGGDCPAGWTYFPKTHACYYMLPDAFYTFIDAEFRCRALGGHLASIHSPLENRFVAMLMEVPYVRSFQDLAWIGLKIENANASWTDGSGFSFNNWLEGEPNPGPGIYGAIMYANLLPTDPVETLRKWDDIKGKTELRSGICKKSVI